MVNLLLAYLLACLLIVYVSRSVIKRNIRVVLQLQTVQDLRNKFRKNRRTTNFSTVETGDIYGQHIS